MYWQGWDRDEKIQSHWEKRVKNGIGDEIKPEAKRLLKTQTGSSGPDSKPATDKAGVRQLTQMSSNEQQTR